MSVLYASVKSCHLNCVCACCIVVLVFSYFSVLLILLPIIIADDGPLQWLGGIGLIGCVAQLFIFERMQKKGNEVI